MSGSEGLDRTSGCKSPESAAAGPSATQVIRFMRVPVYFGQPTEHLPHPSVLINLLRSRLTHSHPPSRLYRATQTILAFVGSRPRDTILGPILCANRSVD